MAATQQELQEISISPRCMLLVRLIHELPEEILKEKILDQPVYQSSKAIFEYLYYSMRDLRKEVFKVIYLNNRNQIIDAVNLFEGTLKAISINPREIVERAIENYASALVFAHNHPSGDPTPSRSDKHLTRDLVFMGKILQIKVLDHLVIGDNTYFSFADEGLIEKYELDFVSIRIRSIPDSDGMSDSSTSYSIWR